MFWLRRFAPWIYLCLVSGLLVYNLAIDPNSLVMKLLFFAVIIASYPTFQYLRRLGEADKMKDENEESHPATDQFMSGRLQDDESDESEYGSMAELVQAGKRKNEVQ